MDCTAIILNLLDVVPSAVIVRAHHHLVAVMRRQFPYQLAYRHSVLSVLAGPKPNQDIQRMRYSRNADVSRWVSFLDSMPAIRHKAHKVSCIGPWDAMDNSLYSMAAYLPIAPLLGKPNKGVENYKMKDAICILPVFHIPNPSTRCNRCQCHTSS